MPPQATTIATTPYMPTSQQWQPQRRWRWQSTTTSTSTSHLSTTTINHYHCERQQQQPWSAVGRILGCQACSTIIFAVFSTYSIYKQYLWQPSDGPQGLVDWGTRDSTCLYWNPRKAPEVDNTKCVPWEHENMSGYMRLGPMQARRGHAYTCIAL